MVRGIGALLFGYPAGVVRPGFQKTICYGSHMRKPLPLAIFVCAAAWAWGAVGEPAKTDTQKAFDRAVAAYRGGYYKVKEQVLAESAKDLREAKKELSEAKQISVARLRALKTAEAQAKMARGEARIARLKDGQAPLALAFSDGKGALASFDGEEIKSVSAYFSPVYHNVFLIRGAREVTTNHMARQVVDNNGTRIILTPKVVGQTTESESFAPWVIIAGEDEPICKKRDSHRSSSKPPADAPVSDKAEFIGTIQSKVLLNSAVAGKVLYFTGDMVHGIPVKGGRHDALVAYCFEAQALHDAAFPEWAAERKRAEEKRKQAKNSRSAM